jgi:hypothetical protein
MTDKYHFIMDKEDNMKDDWEEKSRKTSNMWAQAVHNVENEDLLESRTWEA